VGLACEHAAFGVRESCRDGAARRDQGGLGDAGQSRRRRAAVAQAGGVVGQGRGQWGADLPLSGTTNPALGIDALVVALTARFGGGRDAVVHLQLDDDHIRLTVRDGRLRAGRAEPDDTDDTVVTTPATLQSLVFAESTLADVEQAGDLTITGDRTVVERLFG